MSSFTNYTENLLLNYLLTANAVTRPTQWYVGLFTSAPSDTGGGTEVSGSGYTRMSTGTMTISGTATSAVNAAAIEFPAASGGNWGAITHAAILDASTSGTMLAWAPLTVGRTINDGDVFRFPASSLTVTLT